MLEERLRGEGGAKGLGTGSVFSGARYRGPGFGLRSRTFGGGAVGRAALLFPSRFSFRVGCRASTVATDITRAQQSASFKAMAQTGPETSRRGDQLELTEAVSDSTG